MLLKSFILLFLAYGIVAGCQPREAKDKPEQHFRTVDYVKVGKQMEHVRTPYVIDLSNREKSKH